MFIPNVGPKSVSGIHVGPADDVVRKFVVFQIPPDAAPRYTVLPDGSDGSTARPPTRPDTSAFSPAPFAPMPAGPTAVHVLLASGFVGFIVKMRKLAVVWSLTASPR